MSETVSTASLKKLFRFPFQGTGWQGRFAVGSALLLANYVIPIVPALFVGGYILRVMRQAIEGQEPTLPDWDDWGRLAKDGLSVMLINLVYFLPALILFVGGWPSTLPAACTFPWPPVPAASRRSRCSSWG